MDGLLFLLRLIVLFHRAAHGCAHGGRAVRTGVVAAQYGVNFHLGCLHLGVQLGGGYAQRAAAPG